MADITVTYAGVSITAQITGPEASRVLSEHKLSMAGSPTDPEAKKDIGRQAILQITGQATRREGRRQRADIVPSPITPIEL